VIAELLLQALVATPAKAAKAKGAGERVTIDDIESHLRGLVGGVSESVEKAKLPLIGGGVAAVVLLVLLVFFLGKRRGRKRSTIVEIRRVV
jgi:thiamine monophosphate kinase